VSEHHFGLVRGSVDRRRCTGRKAKAAIRRIERDFASDRVTWDEIVEPNGEWRGWWSCANRGEPFNRATARAVLDAFRAALPPE
jgi:hypothetical protein